MLVVAENFFLGPVVDAHTAEALALKRGLVLARGFRIHHLIVQSDYLQLVECMNNGYGSPSIAALIIDDCFDACREFGRVSFVHCARELTAWLMNLIS